MLERALAFYQTFLKERQRDGALKLETARALVRLGDIEEMLGHHGEAGRDYRDALDRLRPLAAVAAAPADARRALAAALHGRGILLRKKQPFPRGRGLVPRGPSSSASSSPGRTRTTPTTSATWPRPATSSERCCARNGAGASNEVEDAYQAAIQAVEALPASSRATLEPARRCARYLNNFGRSLWSTGRVGQAETLFRDAAEDLEKVAKAAPVAVGVRLQLARLHANLGVLLFAERQLERAETHGSCAVELLEGLATDFPGIPDYRRELASVLTSLAAIRLQAQPPKTDEARQNLERARDLLEAGRRPSRGPRLPVAAGQYLDLAGRPDRVADPKNPKKADVIYQRAIEAERCCSSGIRGFPSTRGSSGGFMRVTAGCFTGVVRPTRPDRSSGRPLRMTEGAGITG